MSIVKHLSGHTSEASAYVVEDYPYGYTLRTTIRYWIETVKGKGDRFCSQTINPKTGRWNKPKKSTYSTFLYLYLNEDGHVKCGGYDFNEKYADLMPLLNKVKALAAHTTISDIQKENMKDRIIMAAIVSAGWNKPSDPALEADWKQWAGQIKAQYAKDLMDIVLPEKPNWEAKKVIFVESAPISLMSMMGK